MGQCSGTSHERDTSSVVRSTGKKKALLVGINYRGSPSELRGCINDIMNQKQVLIEHYGFNEADIYMLHEDLAKDRWPYKAAIQEGFRWLYEGAKSGDLLFFQYSGHGSQCHNNGSMADCICPLDCLDNPWPGSVILDTEIHRDLYDPLPAGCKSVAVFDCCHSGTVANLTVKRGWSVLSLENEPKPRYMPPPKEMQHYASMSVAGIRRAVVSGKYPDHQLWVFSGCQDDQTSADAFEEGQYQGAFTWAFVKALKFDVWNEAYFDLLEQIKMNLKTGMYTQVPALTTTQTAFLNWYYMGKAPEVPEDKELADCGVTILGKKKALLVGINYRGKPNELRGCINDVVNHKAVLMHIYGYQEADILMLTEDEDKLNWPCKQRVQEGLKWLVEGASEGDSLLFHYSGHGSQMTDMTGSEPTGLSECICPFDCDKPWPEHIILDTEIHTDVYDKLPDGVKLECIFDCCHSGTVANLEVFREMVPMVPEEYNGIRYYPPPQACCQPSSPSASALSCIRSGTAEPKKGSGFRKAVQTAAGYKDKLLWVYSGCQDNQTSADAYEDAQYQGAFTWAFLKTLEDHRYSMRQGALLRAIRDQLCGRYVQTPALSTTSREYFQTFHLAQTRPISTGFKTCSGPTCRR
mmetsp:Transcript_65215/g.187531  ORF Transcript_65215/g.187531 Transcript_65215/m.187531 type:complete len:635 (+) Transcript_65215:56-1960(+)